MNRRTPLVSTTPLSRVTPLPRTGPLPSSAGLRTSGLRPVNLTVVRDIGSGEAERKPSRKPEDMPNDYIPPKVRKLVLERDGYACVCCGKSIIGQRYSLGHRLRASQGGKAEPPNLITLLGWGGQEHHGRIDSRLDPRDEDNGYTVRSGQDPATIPVVVAGEYGSKRVWLTDDGRYVYEPPEPDGGSAA